MSIGNLRFVTRSNTRRDCESVKGLTYPHALGKVVKHTRRLAVSKQRLSHELRLAQRAIVTQLLRDDHDRSWTVAELRREVTGFTRYRFTQALDFLEGNQVITRDAHGVSASLCARALDELGLVGI
jgi:hypothetical protein